MADTSRFLSCALAAAAAPSADNSQPWRFTSEAGRFEVRYRPHPGLDPFGADGHASVLSFGALAHNLGLALGVPAEALALADADGNAPLLSVGSEMQGMAELDAKHPLFLRHTNRFPFADDVPPVASLKALESIARPLARAELLTDQKQIQRYCDLSLRCSEARFCSQELHEWLMGSLRFTQDEVATGTGLDAQTLHLPPGGTLFMRFITPWARMSVLNRLGAYKAMARIDTAPLRQAPLIIAIVGENSRAGIFQAGQLMQELWILLNTEGWAVHPYYNVADQQSRLREERLARQWQPAIESAMSDLTSLLALEANERFHIALRVGRPTRDPVRSRRLPVEQLTSAADNAG